MNTGNNRTENEAVARGGDYLWDGSGKADPEIQRLEVLLGRFRHDRHALCMDRTQQRILKESHQEAFCGFL